MAVKLRRGLEGTHFVHPLDRGGMRALVDRISASPARTQLDRLAREAEEEFYLLNLADNTRLSEAQGGSVHRLVASVAGVLGMPVPHVFLDSSPALRPRALGREKACLVLPSASSTASTRGRSGPPSDASSGTCSAGTASSGSSPRASTGSWALRAACRSSGRCSWG